MKDKIKNLGEKMKYAFLFMLTVVIYVVLFVGMAWYCVDIGFGIGVFISGCALVSGIPIMIGKNVIANIKQEVENRNLKKEMLNNLLKSMEEQYKCTIQEVEVQNIESQNDHNLYAKENISHDNKMLEILKETIEKDENSINRTTALEVISHYEQIKRQMVATSNKEGLTQLKQELTLLSFQLQEIAARYKADKTIEEMYDSREDLIRIRTNRKIENKE